MQLLLHLAENGHTCFVQELLKYPLQHGVDVLALNLLAAGSSSHLAHELLSTLFVAFLSESAPAAAVCVGVCVLRGGGGTNGMTPCILESLFDLWMLWFIVDPCRTFSG